MSAPLRVVVTDPLVSGFADELCATALPHEWRFVADAPVDARRSAIADADVLVCARLTPEETADAASLRLVHVTGAGIDRLAPGSVPAGVPVCSTGHHGAAIAEHVLMTALMLRRGALEADARLRRGQWRTVATDASMPFHRMLAGDTIGLWGMGEIGSAVARLAAAFGMRVVALRRDVSAVPPRGVDIARTFGLDEQQAFLEESHVVVVSIPLADSTRGIVDAAALAAMGPEAILVNVARGDVVDEDALFDALVGGTIGGAAIDVWWGAPSGDVAPPAVARFAPLPRTVLTPHFSGHAREVFTARAADIAANIDRLAAGEPLARRAR